MKQSGEEFVSVIDKYKSVAQYLWRIIVIQAIVILFLAFGYFELKETVRVEVELPSKLIYKHSPVVVAGIDGASEIYFKMWGKYIAEELANISYENASNKLKLLSKMMHPEDFVEQKKTIEGLVNHIVNNSIKQTFSIVEDKFIPLKKDDELVKESIYIIKGDASQTIGKELLNKSCEYKIKFEYLKGVIYVKKFTTNCF